MARKHEAVEWLDKGLSPSAIARQMGITVSSVMGYLYNQVGEGRIRRSDIVFSIDKELRDAVESDISKSRSRSPNYEPTIWKSWKINVRLTKKGIPCNEEDLRVYLSLRDARVAMGDMYEYIRDIELFLHNQIRDVLSRGYGHDRWWKEGIPQSIRKECRIAQEGDLDPGDDPFAYTNIVHLKEILRANWAKFSRILPGNLVVDRRLFFSSLDRLNSIRNGVMHPVKGRPIAEDDFAFVRDFAKSLGVLRLRSKTGVRVSVDFIATEELRAGLGE